MATVDAERSATKSGRSNPAGLPQPDPGHHQLLLSLTHETNQRIDDLSRRTGYDKGELIDIAINLLRLSLEAVEEGKLVGVAGPDQELELEFVGLRKDDPTSV